MPRTVAELLDHAAKHFGEATFLSAGGQVCTFGEFVERVRRTAGALHAKGLRAGDRVAVLLPRGQDETVVLLATMLAKAIAVPMHRKLKDAQVRHILDDAEPRLVVTCANRTVGLHDAEAVLRDQCVIDVDCAIADGKSGEDHDAEHGAAPSDAAVLLYTSGSTGLAKGIVQTNENLVLGARIVADYLELSADDHVLALLSFSFDYGLNQLLTALLVGCRLTVADHLGVGELASLLATHRPTGLAGVPSLWHEVAQGLQTGVLSTQHGGSLRYITNTGGVLQGSDAQVMRATWPHVQVFAMYGLTEAFRSACLPPAEFDRYPDSFGYAIAGVELLLVSPAHGTVLEGPATGELVHVGALVSNGYWRRPEQDAARFRPDPRESDPQRAGGTGRVVYSGDLVRRDEAGRHYFVSRLDRMLKVYGHRVSPDEVARSVLGMAGVGEVAVLGLAGGADGHRIVLCIAGDVGDAALLAAVRRRCRAQLPSYMMPAVIQVMTQLPHNINGKVDEPALRAMLDACTDGT